MRALTHVKAFDYGNAPSLAGLGLVEVTDAAPEFAAALVEAIRGFGGQAQLVSAPQSGLCLLTEGLSDAPAAGRHAAALNALLSCADKGFPAFVLDRSEADQLAKIGGCAGLCRSLRIERPGAQVFAFSLDAVNDPETCAARVVQALGAPRTDYTLRADGGWYDLPGPDLLPPAPHAALPTAPVWLVTGGGRGVTADCAVELARRTGGTFLLLGRSGLTQWPDWLAPETDLKALRGQLARNASRPDMPKKPAEIDRLARSLLAGAEISGTLQAIGEAGGKALYLQADIADPAQIQRVLADAQQSEGRITGLVHGAGVLSDGRAEALQLADFEKVFAPKVGGFETVLSCLDTRALSHIGVFSSASAVFGNTGQANYAAANAWLNNVAETLSRTLPQARVKSFCWGPWQGGMVDDALARMFIERGIGLISRPEGARIFADMLLNSPKDQVRFVVGDEWGEA